MKDDELAGTAGLGEGGTGREAKELGGETTYEICDLRDIGALQKAFAALQAKLGNCSVLVNNAARDDRHKWQDVTPEYWDDRLNTNLRHFFFAMQAVAPGMMLLAADRLSTWGPTAGGRRWAVSRLTQRQNRRCMD